MHQSSMFGKQLPPKLSRALREHSRGFFHCDIEELRCKIQTHLSKFEDALAYNEFLDIDTAKKIARVFDILLSQFEGFSESKKTLIFGATQYFVDDLDAQPDTQSILGLDDDVAVLNFVLDEIGRPDLKVNL